MFWVGVRVEVMVGVSNRVRAGGRFSVRVMVSIGVRVKVGVRVRARGRLRVREGCQTGRQQPPINLEWYCVNEN